MDKFDKYISNTNKFTHKLKKDERPKQTTKPAEDPVIPTPEKMFIHDETPPCNIPVADVVVSFGLNPEEGADVDTILRCLTSMKLLTCKEAVWTFFMYFHRFMTPDYLVEKLLYLFQHSEDDPIRSRIVIFFQFLVDQWWEVIETTCNPATLYENISYWNYDVSQEYNPALQKHLVNLQAVFLKMSQKVKQDQRQPVFFYFTQYLDESLAGKFSWRDFVSDSTSPFGFAQQLTFYHEYIYSQITPYQLTSYKPHSIASGYNALEYFIYYFNILSKWVKTVIVLELDLKKRSKLLRKLISLADALLDLKNFMAVFSIVSGLSSSVIYRLTETWAGAQDGEVWKNLQVVISPKNGFMGLRDAMKNWPNRPSIPYFGIFQTDLIHMNDALPDTINGDKINFLKYATMARCAFEMFKTQPKFDVEPMTETIYFLHTLRDSIIDDEDDLFNRSLQIQPKKSANPNPQNPNQPSVQFSNTPAPTSTSPPSVSPPLTPVPSVSPPNPTVSQTMALPMPQTPVPVSPPISVAPPSSAAPLPIPAQPRPSKLEGEKQSTMVHSGSRGMLNEQVSKDSPRGNSSSEEHSEREAYPIKKVDKKKRDDPISKQQEIFQLQMERIFAKNQKAIQQSFKNLSTFETGITESALSEFEAVLTNNMNDMKDIVGLLATGLFSAQAEIAELKKEISSDVTKRTRKSHSLTRSQSRGRMMVNTKETILESKKDEEADELPKELGVRIISTPTLPIAQVERPPERPSTQSPRQTEASKALQNPNRDVHPVQAFLAQSQPQPTQAPSHLQSSAPVPLPSSNPQPPVPLAQSSPPTQPVMSSSPTTPQPFTIPGFERPNPPVGATQNQQRTTLQRSLSSPKVPASQVQSPSNQVQPPITISIPGVNGQPPAATRDPQTVGVGQNYKVFDNPASLSPAGTPNSSLSGASTPGTLTPGTSTPLTFSPAMKHQRSATLSSGVSPLQRVQPLSPSPQPRDPGLTLQRASSPPPTKSVQINHPILQNQVPTNSHTGSAPPAHLTGSPNSNSSRVAASLPFVPEKPAPPKNKFDLASQFNLESKVMDFLLRYLSMNPTLPPYPREAVAAVKGMTIGDYIRVSESGFEFGFSAQVHACILNFSQSL